MQFAKLLDKDKLPCSKIASFNLTNIECQDTWWNVAIILKKEFKHFIYKLWFLILLVFMTKYKSLKNNLITYTITGGTFK